MNIRYIIAKGLKKILNPPALNSCDIHKTSRVCSGSELTNVKMGKYSYIGNRCFLVNTNIGSFCSIADKCSIGGATHPMQRVSTSPVFHEGKNILGYNFSNFSFIPTPTTIIENDVWLGMGCYIKAGVRIHNGAVVGMGSVVTKDIPAYEVWAGCPAHKICDRFKDVNIEQFENIKWWDLDDTTIKEYADCFDSPQHLIKKMTSD